MRSYYYDHNGHRDFMNADYYRSDPYLHDEHVHHSLEQYSSRHSPHRSKYTYPEECLDLDDYYERRSLAPHYRDFRGYDRDCRWGSDEELRRSVIVPLLPSLAHVH